MRKWLRELRINAGLSQKEMAQRVGVTAQFYNYVENGKRRPSFEVAEKIAEILCFDWTLFFKIKGNSNSLKVIDKTGCEF